MPKIASPIEPAGDFPAIYASDIEETSGRRFPKQFPTRQDAKDAILGGMSADEGDLVTFDGVAIRKLTGATEIDDLPGWIHDGLIDVRQFGDITDDPDHNLAVIQNMLDAAEDGDVIRYTRTSSPYTFSDDPILGGRADNVLYISEDVDYLNPSDPGSAMPGIVSKAAGRFARVTYHSVDDSEQNSLMLLSYVAQGGTEVASQRNGLNVYCDNEMETYFTEAGWPSDTNGLVAGHFIGRVVSGVTYGKVWGLNPKGVIESGADGSATGIEIDIFNEGSIQRDPDGIGGKTGLLLVTKDLASTVAVKVTDGAFGDGWDNAFYVKGTALSDWEDATVFRYGDLFQIDRWGDVYVGKPDKGDSDEGVSLHTDGTIHISAEGEVQSTNIYRVLPLGHDIARTNVFSENADGDVVQFSRSRYIVDDDTAGAHGGRYSIQNAIGGTLLEDARFGDGVSVGNVPTDGHGILTVANGVIIGSGELLDEYDAGGFIARISDNSGNNVPGTVTGYYTKVGDTVTINIPAFTNIDTSGLVSTDALYINLPFTVSAESVGVVRLGSLASETRPIVARAIPGATRLSFATQGGTSASRPLLVSDFVSGSSSIRNVNMSYGA